MGLTVIRPPACYNLISQNTDQICSKAAQVCLPYANYEWEPPYAHPQVDCVENTWKVNKQVVFVETIYI